MTNEHLQSLIGKTVYAVYNCYNVCRIEKAKIVKAGTYIDNDKISPFVEDDEGTQYFEWCENIDDAIVKVTEFLTAESE